jgi:NitT/TauT family transport system substrate-binding protein
MQIMQSRRRFLAALSSASAAGLVGAPRSLQAEPPPETGTLRVPHIGAVCAAPILLAGEFLQGEGFTDVRYTELESSTDVDEALASGEADITLDFVGGLIIHMDRGDPIVILGAGHIGCAELFGTDRVRAISDLKGKTVAVPALGAGSMQHLIVSSMATYIGIDPRTEINFVVHPNAEAMQMFAEGKIDAYLGAPPRAQELRARKIGHVVVDTMMDRPWSQYLCCVVAGNREFVQQHPVATKRALRAILRANDLCSAEPERVVRVLMEKGWTKQYDYALEALRMTPYEKWREYDPEDTVRFWALRLHEAGMIEAAPNEIIARGTDFSFFDELKRELKT